MKKIKLGFVGGGFNGQIGFIENFSKNNSCKIWGLAEVRTKLRKKISKKYKIKNQYLSHKDLIKDIEDYDGIVIVTRRNMMPAIAFDFLKLGKPVFTEKPMASTFNQAKKLISTAKKGKSLYKIGYNKIYDQGIKKGKEIFEKFKLNKKLGNVILIKSHRLSGDGYDKKNNYIKTAEGNFLAKPFWPSKPNWLPNKYKKSYEKYLNLYSHNINLIRYFTNIIPKVKFSDLSEKKMSTVIFDCGNYSAILETGFFTKKGWDESFEIYFEKGSIKISLPPQHYKKKAAECIIYQNNKKKKISKKFKSWSFKRQADDFINDIKLNKVTTNNAFDIINDMKLIEDVWKKFLKK